MTDPTLLQRITARPDVFGGKPIIRDLRLSVALILSLLAQGVTPEALLEDYPGLELADIHACLAYAHAVIAGDSLDTIVGTPHVKFLVDRCAGQRVAAWLQRQGHDVVRAWDTGLDPGDAALLRWAAAEHRVLVTPSTRILGRWSTCRGSHMQAWSVCLMCLRLNGCVCLPRSWNATPRPWKHTL